MGFRATLNFRKFKVALIPMYRMFLNFAKSCVLSCLSNANNIKKFHFSHKKICRFNENASLRFLINEPIISDYLQVLHESFATRFSLDE